MSNDKTTSEAQKLAPILRGMIEGCEDTEGVDIYADGFSCSDGDVYVNRAAQLLLEQAQRIAELEKDAARTKHIDGLSDDDLWHIAGVVEYMSKGSLRGVSQHECVTEIRAAFMDPDAGRAYLKASKTDDA